MRKKKPKFDPIVPPADPIDVEEMAFAMRVFEGGLRLVLPTQNPEDRGIEVGDILRAEQFVAALPHPLQQFFVARGSKVSPKDMPVHRAFGAVMQHYKDNPKRTSIGMRAMAFYFMVNTPEGRKELETKWMKPDDDPNSQFVLMHPAINDAIAVTRTGKYGQFDARDFFQNVAKIAREKYPRKNWLRTQPPARDPDYLQVGTTREVSHCKRSGSTLL